MDMDFDLTDEPIQLTTSSRAPSRFKPKIPKSEPKPESDKTLILPDLEIKQEQPYEELQEEEEVVSTELMEVDEEEEDTVVREIDVFFKPSPVDADTQLYVLQYPLRPSWRAYNMERNCREVRLKPEKGQVEIDVSLDIDANYDSNSVKDNNLKITKQTLVSKKVPLTRGCALGVLVGNKLHLNPVNAAVQLRPSMKHVTSGASEEKSSLEAMVKSENGTGGPKPSRMQGNMVRGKNSVDAMVKVEEGTGGPRPSRMQVRSPLSLQGNMVRPLNGNAIDVDEPWVSLEYNGMDSIFSSRFLEKMTSEESTPIQFTMNQYDYVNALCPPTPIEGDTSKSVLRRLCMSLPLEEKFRKWFAEGDQVNRFVLLKYLAPNDPDEIVLQEIQRHANLVQGLWVSKTSLLPLKGAEQVVRDEFLCLFSKSDLIPRLSVENLLEAAGFRNDIVRKAAKDAVLTAIAVQRDKGGDWKFKVPTDVSFIKDHPEIVKEQEKLWGINEKKMELRRNEASKRNKLRPSLATGKTASGIKIKG